MNCRIIYLVLIVSLTLTSCKKTEVGTKKDMRIAFMADVHLHDIYSTFLDTDYKGIRNPSTGKYNTIRTMEAQLHSTRLFNENYFAFIAALEDAVKKGIKLIALPGDFSDDGQPMNVRALRKILDEYATKYGVTFLIITGNHDPVRPFDQEAGKKDFLGESGQSQAIMSEQDLFKVNGLDPIITQDIKTWGYSGVLNELSDFGFFPQEKFLYWETPFSNYNYDDYNLNKALSISKLSQREYPISENLMVPDASYLVEPQEGLWLLALDANVYVPTKSANSVSQNPKNYKGASIGYNNVLTHKKHIIQWVGKVAKEAQKREKLLVAFSHYPMVEFNDGASELTKTVFGDHKMQLHRVPKGDVARVFADIGVKLHFGGHMHINDTGIHKTEKGNVLINVQTPSLAAYPAAYKILTVQSNDILEVETVPIVSVPNFKELFPLYEMEHDYLAKSKDVHIWSQEILNSRNYREYVTWHLKEVVRLRFLPEDWPQELKEQFLNVSGKELLVSAVMDRDTLKLQKKLIKEGMEMIDFQAWNGNDFVFDFHRLHNGDHLALNDIGAKRIQQYKILLDVLSQAENSAMKNLARDFSKIFQKHFEGAPSDHFLINLKNGEVEVIKNN